MRKVYLIASILLLSSVWLVAQTSPSSSGSSSQQPSATDQSSPSSTSPSQSSPSTTTTQTTTTQTTETSNGNSIEGCLSGSSGNYTLTDSTGKSWQLAGDTSKLTEHVGHQVRITGSEAGGGSASGSASSSGAGSSASGSSGGSGSSSGSQSTFTVQKVKMISSSCPSK